jgi:hypothetical protein
MANLVETDAGLLAFEGETVPLSKQVCPAAGARYTSSLDARARAIPIQTST